MSRLPRSGVRRGSRRRAIGLGSGAARLPAHVPVHMALLTLPRAEMFKVADAVETVVALPGIPAGSQGRVKEIGHPFVAVEFEDGRVGYYSPRQLRKPKVEGPRVRGQGPEA